MENSQIASAAEPAVTFDEFSRIRILPSDQFETADHLKDDCKEFTQRISDFSSIVQVFLELLQEKANLIETEKLRAIGLRNRVENEVENRRKTQRQMQLVLKERQAELQRLMVQSESLQNVILEQQSMIEQLNSK